MNKYFNIAGPCHADDHYMLPAQGRCKNIKKLIDQKQYFVIHAARQSGKTTLLLDLARERLFLMIKMIFYRYAIFAPKI